MQPGLDVSHSSNAVDALPRTYHSQICVVHCCQSPRRGRRYHGRRRRPASDAPAPASSAAPAPFSEGQLVGANTFRQELCLQLTPARSPCRWPSAPPPSALSAWLREQRGPLPAPQTPLRPRSCPQLLPFCRVWLDRSLRRYLVEEMPLFSLKAGSHANAGLHEFGPPVKINLFGGDRKTKQHARPAATP